METIEIEKPKKTTEKQIEHLKKMREKKMEISKAKKVLKIENPVQSNTQIRDISPDFKTRLTALERDISEIKMRKQIKAELKEKLKRAQFEKKKCVDIQQDSDKSQEIKEVQKEIKTFDFRNDLFY